ncbi:MAG: site-specific DNA-methyltransferase [Prevotella sp.]|nr:site-specific DNA-methyltransferase [Prevotella sp.]
MIWARKKEKVPHYYNYELMKHINGDKQMTNVWRLSAIAPWEKACTKHPTQKPLGLLSRIILASTQPGAWILDPFAASSTTGIAANLLGRCFLGIEKEDEFSKISKARREEIEDVKTFATFRRKIPDIVKAEDTQTDLFMCHESDPIVRLPFLEEEIVERTDVLMYAANMTTRKKTEPVGKLALGMKEGELDDLMFSKIGYIMFHYWNNQEATAYRITNTPRIVSKQDIPDGYLLRLATNVQKYLLLEYVPGKPVDIGAFDIMKVQRKGKGRYMPFVTQLDNII